VGSNSDAAAEITRRLVEEKGAVFGWHRLTPPQLAAVLARPLLVQRNLVAISRIGAEALVTRVVHNLASGGELGRYAEIALGPGFARAVTDVLIELRLAGQAGETIQRIVPELAAILERYEEQLAAAGFADWPSVLSAATEVAQRGDSHQLLGLATLLLDVRIASEAESKLAAAVCSRARNVIATAPTGDETTAGFYRDHLKFDVIDLDYSPISAEITEDKKKGSLARLQSRLFVEDPAAAAITPDEEVAIFSAPGEGRECAEIARGILETARDGVPFDRMAVLLRSPEAYQSYLEEAFARAGIPTHFAKGSIRPDPSGRAFYVLLCCATEKLSARRFAEYLSLAQVPNATDDGGPPEAKPREDRWVTPGDDPTASLAGPATPTEAKPAEVSEPESRASPLIAGEVRAPRRWERLLVEAAVIGGRERWRRRIEGLRNELRMKLAELDDEGDARAAFVQHTLDDLDAFAGYALPLIDTLDGLPTRSLWGDWLDHLGALATRALRYPDRVLAILSELAPLAPVGPVTLREVLLVLSRSLLEVAVPPPVQRYGHVFVAPIEAARGLSFDTVFVPGLAEKMFPGKIAEEPMLLDAARRQIGTALRTNDDRVASERLNLSIAAGAAARRLLFSYPRINLEQGRPRVPSFYALEVVRAAEHRLPNFAELADRAETATSSRLGWPAPIDPASAIDDAEYDLAILNHIVNAKADGAGTARYILASNPYVARALRARYQRWSRGWSPSDGLLSKSDAVRAVMAKHAFATRSYSATALQHFARCPYRFYLDAIQRLAPRDVPESIDELDPLQRGALIHAIQFDLFGRLREEKLLPITRERLERASEILDRAVAENAARVRDELAPAINRVWQDSIAAIRSDLREWLRRMTEDDSGYVPWRFELSFGLPGRDESRSADPCSVEEPVEIDCGIRLRGSIDLVERRSDRSLRVTDHKTGRFRAKGDQLIDGGRSLQPVLYALAAEKLFPDQTVEAGRLYFSTSAGNFADHIVPLDDDARQAALRVAETVGNAMAEPSLPAAPDQDGCDRCDYRPVCGPYEVFRVRRKPPSRLAALITLRAMP
jgi:CRISPR/Cas system-associated exonuclease Cas4 (RecB family)